MKKQNEGFLKILKKGFLKKSAEISRNNVILLYQT